MSDPTPWRAMLAAALRAGVPPDRFWRLSLAEWRSLMAPPPAEILNRAAFAALAERFPDFTP
jgi:hypothetical protein